MLDPKSYELIDFGKGRKLERFGETTLDRPSPAADGHPWQHPDRWSEADAKFHRKGEKGQWKPSIDKLSPFDSGSFQLGLRPTPFGHVGVFPEQVENWMWIARQIARRKSPVRVLNLFAYTGASTLAAAAAGADVVHVDAAKNVVDWARDNAALSGLADANVRWIVEDVKRFVRREVKRKNQYDAIILDPPSYGHGPKGEVWKISRDLLELLEDCAELLSEQRAFVLLSCHSPGYGPAETGASLQQAVFGRCSGQVETRSLNLRTADGQKLPAGVTARVAF